jgi:hypothetical protein
MAFQEFEGPQEAELREYPNALHPPSRTGLPPIEVPGTEAQRCLEKPELRVECEH